MYKSSQILSASKRTALLPLAIASALPLALVAEQPALALSFRFNFEPGVPSDFQVAAQEAADIWSSALKDDVLIDLKVGYTDLSSYGPVLGGAQPAKVKVKYEDYVDAIYRDVTSANDLSALNGLQLSAEGRQIVQAYESGSQLDKNELKSEDFAFLLDSQFANGNGSGESVIDANGSSNNQFVSLTQAQASALGLGKDNKDLDGLIQLNSAVSWDTDRSNGVDADSYDAVSVFQHEIGHMLGMISGADSLDFLAAASAPVDIDKDSFSYLTPLDLYRYSDESAALGVSDLTLGGESKYFSLDGGKTAVVNENGQVAYFSTGSESSGGNGYQASHWLPSDSPLGVTNPVLKKGQSIDVSKLDLTVLDSVGWNVVDNSAEQAAAIGLDWEQLTNDLAEQRAAVTDSLVQEWGDDLPAFESALTDASLEIDLEFQEKFRKEFNDLLEKANEGKLKEPDKEIAKFEEKVREEADKRDDDIRKVPKEIAKIDEKVSEWLTLSTDKLADKVKDADGAEINRLSNIVKAAPPEEQAVLEPKLEAAFAQFSDEPDKLVEELLDTSGPANPYAWGLGTSTWWYLQVAEANDSDLNEIDDSGLLYATADQVDPIYFSSLDPVDLAAASLKTLGDGDDGATDIPEPSSVLALFGIAVLGLGATRRKRQS